MRFSATHSETSNKFIMEGNDVGIHFLDLPEIVVEKILSYISYEELAHLRVVCRRFNQVNQMLLNQGFRKVERYQAKCLKEVKSQLPRRESERRNHPLFRHCDILTAIETRLSLLNMTFIKYVDCHMCCFIPGKVIDEIYRVLRFIQNNKTLPRSHEILTELRDISSMAMEHFEEKIIRTLKPTPLMPSSPRFPLSSPYSSLSSLSSSPGSSTAGSPSSKSLTSSSSAADELPQLITSNKYYRNCVTILKKEVAELKSKLNEMRRKVSEQERVALEQSRILSQQTVKLNNQEGKLSEVSRKLIKYDQHFSELQAEMARLKEECNRGSGITSSSSKRASGSWQREDKNQQFYASHGLTAPAIGSTLFVPANMMQPSLLPVNLAPPQLPSPAYLTSAPLAAYSSNGMALSMSPATEPSPSTTIYSTRAVSPSAGFAANGHGTFSQSPAPLQEATSHNTQSMKSASTSEISDEAGTSCGKSHGKKNRKRKLSEDEGNVDILQKKWTKM